MKILKYKQALSPNLVFTISIWFVIILGAALRLYDLGTESYWYDEVYTVHLAQENIGQLLAVKELNWPPVYYGLIHYWVQLLGTTESATRLFSAIAGIVSMAFTYLIGRELFGKYVGFFSTLLMAISEFQISYSQETRFYSLFLLATLLSFFFYIKTLRTSRNGYFLLYGMASILLVYCHAFGVFVIAAQNLYFFLRWKMYRETRAQWFLCQGAIFLAIAPHFLPIILEGKRIAGADATGIEWIPNPSVWAPLRTVYRYVFPLRHDRSWTSISLNFAVGTAIFVIGVLLFAIGKRKGQWIASLKKTFSDKHLLVNKADELLLVGCWFLCPIILPFVLSKIVGPMYVDRYTISAAPAFYLMLAFSIISVRKVVPVFVSLMTLVILIAPGLQHYYIADINEQWRELAAYVDTNASNNDVLVFAPDAGGWQRKSFEWYYRGYIQSCGLRLSDIDDNNAISAALTQCISGHNRFWVIIRGTSDAVDRFQSFFLSSKRNDLSLIKEQKFTGIYIYLFEIKRR